LNISKEPTDAAVMFLGLEMEKADGIPDTSV
jgi:hypothetical protein